jgi:glutaredoxin 2
LVAGYKHVAFERVVLLNDDEKTCFDLIGAKMVPILEHDGALIGESLDICKRLDEIGDEKQIILPASGLDQQVADQLSQVGHAQWALSFPRVIRIGLPEFATEGAQAYFRSKKEKMLEMSFDDALANTGAHKNAVEQVLADLPKLPLPSERENRLSWDDVIIFPRLRGLTLVKGLEFPESIQTYLKEISSLTGVDLYFDRAI